MSFIVDGIRTPIGNFGGALSPVRADDLGALVLKELMARNANLDPALVADVIMGFFVQHLTFAITILELIAISRRYFLNANGFLRISVLI